MAQDSNAHPVKNALAKFADIVTIPAAIGASAYTFVSKTGNELYDTLRNTPKINQINQNHLANDVVFETALEAGATYKDLFKAHHKMWSKNYNTELQEMGFKNIFDRFSGISRNQQIEVIAQSVAVGALVVGFWALLDQLRDRPNKQDKSL